MPKAVKFDSYGGIDVLQVRDVDRPTTAPGWVLVRAPPAGLGRWWCSSQPAPAPR
jgi:NADPH:quinone reductase-like Zn-dependent oxidoreductase